MAVGDILTFELEYNGSPDADQLQIVLTDTLPTTYRYVPALSRYSGSYTGQINNANLSTNPDPLCSTGCPSGAVLGWQLTGSGGNQITPIGQSITIRFQVQVTAGTAGEILTNYGKFTGATSDGGGYSARAQLDLTTLAPNVVMAKSNSSAGVVQGNAIVTYTVTIQNTGTEHGVSDRQPDACGSARPEIPGRRSGHAGERRNRRQLCARPGRLWWHAHLHQSG